MSSIKTEVVEFRDKLKQSLAEDSSDATKQAFEDVVTQFFSVLVDIRDLLTK